MKTAKLFFIVLVAALIGACASKGGSDLKSPCACGESKTHRG